MTTRVDSASSRSDPGSVVSACSSSTSAPMRSRTASSLPRLRPASAQRVPSGAFAARYSAVSAPVKPVAPRITTSYMRSAMARHPRRTAPAGAEPQGMDRAVAVVATLAVGALVAFQPPANALLARHVGDLGATFVSLLISTLIIGVLLVAGGHAGDLSGIGGFRPVHVIGGVSGAAVVFITLV